MSAPILPPYPGKFTPADADPRHYRGALGRYATGVTVVTCQGDRGPIGITANSFASVSLDPPLVLWCPGKASDRLAAFEAAENYAIHVLTSAQATLSEAFAQDGEAFDQVGWAYDEHGVPVFETCLARFDCQREAILEGGDHLMILGKVRTAHVYDGEPLVFSQGNYGQFTPVD